jgi:hypothetical protein
MFDIIALIFQRIKTLIFDLPSATTSLKQWDNSLFADLKISGQAIAIGYFAFWIDQVIFKKIDGDRISFAMQWHGIFPSILMCITFVINDFQRG